MAECPRSYNTPVTYEARDGVAWLTLNRPDVLNALDTALAVTLAQHAKTAADDPDVAILRLAAIVGLGRANELALLTEDISPDEARAIGLVNRVCEPGDLDRTLADVIASARRAAPTATGHTKRLLHESFHRDPRAMIEELIRAQED